MRHNDLLAPAGDLEGETAIALLAATLGVTKGSVTAMIRKLRDLSLADAERYSGIKLTAKGRLPTVDMIRRHRLIELFLVEAQGFDWAEVPEVPVVWGTSRPAKCSTASMNSYAARRLIRTADQDPTFLEFALPRLRPVIRIDAIEASPEVGSARVYGIERFLRVGGR